MKTWSFFDKQTGMFNGRTYSGPDSALALNTREGEGVLEGARDHLSERVDLETGLVVDFQPPLPDDDHVWDPASRRNVIKRDVAERRAKQAVAQAQMDALELKSLRPLRELKLNDKNEAARRRLQAIEGEITRLSIESGLSTPESRSDQIDQT